MRSQLCPSASLPPSGGPPLCPAQPGQPAKARGPAAHRPLSRAVHGPRVGVGAGVERARPMPATLSPALSLPPGGPARLAPAPLPAPPSRDDSEEPSGKCLGAPPSLELQDSCYSSCSETESHSSLSRNASAASEAAASDTLSLEKLCLASPGLPIHLSPLPAHPAAALDDFLLSPDYLRLADFATKLGFSESQLQTVLSALGETGEALPPDQDKVLGELTKLGRESPVDSATGLESSESGDLGLRPVLIDGWSVGMAAGGSGELSWEGVRCSVEFFRQRGHRDVGVWAAGREAESGGALADLDAEGCVVWAADSARPAMLRAAAERDAVLVTNEDLREIAGRQSEELRRAAQDRVLVFNFSEGSFRPSPAPQGRRGPSLDSFLRCQPAASSLPLCPYARKCTYGNKCKFAHPERPNGRHVPVSQRLSDRSSRRQSSKEKSGKAAACRTLSLSAAASQTVPRPAAPATARLGVPEHQALSRHLSAPGPQAGQKGAAQQLPSRLLCPPPAQLLSSSDSGLAASHSSSNLFTPSSAVWGPMEFSVSPVWPSSATNLAKEPREDWDNDRQKLFFHLSHLFPQSLVRSVMRCHPELSDPHSLCSLLCQAQPPHH